MATSCHSIDPASEADNGILPLLAPSIRGGSTVVSACSGSQDPRSSTENKEEQSAGASRMSAGGEGSGEEAERKKGKMGSGGVSSPSSISFFVREAPSVPPPSDCTWWLSSCLPRCTYQFLHHSVPVELRCCRHKLTYIIRYGRSLPCRKTAFCQS